jgi:predicted RNA-binding Zn ribbon-like protein
VDQKVLDTARSLRESIFRAIDALRSGRRAQRKDVQAINRWAADPPLAPQLGEQIGKVKWVSDEPVEAVLATIARDAIALVTGENLARVRECASQTCSVLFLDASRPGRRRWCSMNRCGNRDKKLNYRQRRQAR